MLQPSTERESKVCLRVRGYDGTKVSVGVDVSDYIRIEGYMGAEGYVSAQGCSRIEGYTWYIWLTTSGIKGLLKPKRLGSMVIVARADAGCARFEYGVEEAESEVTELLYC